MLIQVLSDLHLDFGYDKIPTQGDVVVLAGDIHVGTAGVRWAKSNFADTPVVYVAGNHEFYYKQFPNLFEDLRAEAADSNVKLLEQDTCEIDGVRFLGATLWTDFTLNGLTRQESNAAAAKHGINDFHLISKTDGQRLHPMDVAEVHRQSTAWLDSELSKPHTGSTVVVTHHAPCIMCSHPQHRFGSLTAAFSSNLEPLIQEHQPAAWVSGHTHYCSDYRIGSTRLVSNQRGYTDGDIKGFRPNLTIEV